MFAGHCVQGTRPGTADMKLVVETEFYSMSISETVGGSLHCAVGTRRTDAMSRVAWGGEVRMDFMKDITEEVSFDLGLER